MTVAAIYNGSDGAATRALYARLQALCGPAGVIAMNLFRAQKASARAKVYRGGVRGRGSFRDMAYEKKNWSLQNLCAALTEHAAGLGIAWGWREDPKQAFHSWVLYVELPTGQVSFHAAARGQGPDYPRDWDGCKDASAGRIVAWVESVDASASDATLAQVVAQHEESPKPKFQRPKAKTRIPRIKRRAPVQADLFAWAACLDAPARPRRCE